MSLSNEARVRLDVAKRAEEARDDEPMRERDRVRELRKRDMEVRTAEATAPPGEEALRGLPSFEVELGPDGRAYAVEPGVKYER